MLHQIIDAGHSTAVPATLNSADRERQMVLNIADLNSMIREYEAIQAARSAFEGFLGGGLPKGSPILQGDDHLYELGANLEEKICAAQCLSSAAAIVKARFAVKWLNPDTDGDRLGPIMRSIAALSVDEDAAGRVMLSSRPEGLLEAINSYRAGLSDFNANAPQDDEGANAYAERSYIPPMQVLEEWRCAPETKEAALAALTLARDECDRGEGPIVTAMIDAALAYFEVAT